MAVKIKASLLAEAIGSVVTATQAGQSEHTGFVNLEFGKGTVTAHAVGPAFSLRYATEYEGEGTLSVMVLAKRLGDILRKQPEGTVVTVSKDEKNGRLSVVGVGKYWFSTYAGERPMPAFEGGKGKPLGTVNLRTEHLKDFLGRATPWIGRDDPRGHLNGGYIENKDGDLRLVATDGSRMIRCVLASGIGVAEIAHLMHYQVLQELQRACDAGDEVSLEFYKGRMVADVGNVTLAANSLAHAFPSQVDALLSSVGPKAFTVDPQKFVVAAKQAMVNLTMKHRGMEMITTGGELTLAVGARNDDQAQIQVDADVHLDTHLGVNANFIEAAIEAVGREESLVDVYCGKGDSGALVVMSPAQASVMALVMPMRL